MTKKTNSYEKSPVDKKLDKITGYKEGSNKDKAVDKVVKSAINKKGK